MPSGFSKCSKSNCSFVIALIAISSTGNFGEASIINYDAPGDLNDSFVQNTLPPATGRYVPIASGGLSNSGAIDILPAVDIRHTTAIHHLDSFRFSMPGDQITISQWVLRKSISDPTAPMMHLGIASDSDERFDVGTSSNSYASVRLFPSTSDPANRVLLQTEVKTNGSSPIRNTHQSAIVIPDHWYQFEAIFEYSDSTSILIRGTLTDYGTSGETFIQSSSFGPSFFALSGVDQVNGDSSVWAGFRAVSEGGAETLDNFSVVPEPTTAALLALGIVFVFRKRQLMFPAR